MFASYYMLWYKGSSVTQVAILIILKFASYCGSCLRGFEGTEVWFSP